MGYFRNKSLGLGKVEKEVAEIIEKAPLHPHICKNVLKNEQKTLVFGHILLHNSDFGQNYVQNTPPSPLFGKSGEKVAKNEQKTPYFDDLYPKIAEITPFYPHLRPKHPHLPIIWENGPKMVQK